jgi:hypothetical protein
MFDEFVEELIHHKKWTDNKWIEKQPIHHFDEIKDMITENQLYNGIENRIGLREVVDLMIISEILLKNNVSDINLKELIESRKEKFRSKL